MFKKKVENMTKGEGKNAILKDIPFLLCAATVAGSFRKPQTGMFNYIVDKYVPNIDMKSSYYVGDMAGRETDPNDTDRTFALNAGLEFYTPEEYFLKMPSEPYKLKLDLVNLCNISKKSIFSYDEIYTHIECIAADKKKLLILLVGRPGSGKSHFYNVYFKSLGYKYVNQDTLKTKEKCIKAVKESIKAPGNTKIVVDNTNPSKKVRKEYISLAKDANIPVYVLNFTTSLQLSQHNNVYRSVHQGKNRVPDIAYRIYDKNFENPTLEEGISKIFDIDFYPDNSMEKWNKYYV